MYNIRPSRPPKPKKVEELNEKAAGGMTMRRISDRQQSEIISRKVEEIKQNKKKYRRLKMKPLWAVLAQSIGKELNESFIWENGIYKISDDGLNFWDEKGMEWMKSSMGIVMKFLDGVGDIGTAGDECHRCGTNIKDLPNDIKFCPYCGTKTIGRQMNVK